MVFGKVKEWLGIEGIKLEISFAEDVVKSHGEINGKLIYSTKHTQQVTSTIIRLYEEYSRGRGKTKKTDTYLISELEISGSFMVYPEDAKEIPFTLSFNNAQSEMDKMQAKGGITGGFAGMAKKAKGVSSKYYLEAESDIAGTALNPFDKKEVIWTRNS